MGSAAALGCTGRRLAERKSGVGILLMSINRERREKVFGEGAEHDTRGRVCSPWISVKAA